MSFPSSRRAVSDGSIPAAMPVQAALDEHAGRTRVPVWADVRADMSYSAILDFETTPFAPRIAAPSIVIQADDAITPEAAWRHFAAIGAAEKSLPWLGGTSQFHL